MHQTFVSDLVTLIRCGAGEALLGARLASVPGAPPAASLVELARRAAEQGATDEELALAVGVLLALSSSGDEPDGTPAGVRRRGPE